MGPDDDDHPLLLELSSLRQTAVRFQHEAHTAAIKLQHHSLDSSRLHDHIAALEQENARLSHELDILRANPDVPPHPAETQVQDLSLALRRVSEKIVLTENTLLERTSELVEARSELARTKHTIDGAYELAARMRAREETCKARERDLEFKARASEEERKMVDLVVQEYADLVRNLEGRKSANPTSSVTNGSASSITLVDNLQDTKSTLHTMLTAFSTESESLHATIADLNAQVSDLQLTLDAERATATHDRALLSQIRTDLDRLNMEDQTAAKMVARYMKFSQASTNALQQQITTLKARHVSTIATLELQLSITESQLASERARTARLQDALDELCEDLARESYGRRREVALRLALLSREESVAEFMQRWARRARESYARCYNSVQQPIPPDSSEDAVQEAFYRVVSDAEALLSSLDDDVQISDTIRTSGSLARIALAKEAVEALRIELQDEVQKRVEALQKCAYSLPNAHPDGTASEIEDLSQPESSPVHVRDRAPDHLLLTPNGNAKPEYKVPPVDLPPSQDPDSPVSIVGAQEESTDDPFMVAPSVIPSIVKTAERGDLSPSPSINDDTATPATLLVNEEPDAIQHHSPAVSMLDLRQDLQPSQTEELQTTNLVPTHALPNDTSVSPSLEANQNEQVLGKDSTSATSTSTSTPLPVTSKVQPLPTPSPGPPTLLSELGATKHRYDTLQRAFRDCCLALKEIKRTLASSSPAPHIQTKLRQYLETALLRIDDYAEDARVELEIRVADEELTARGFETVLSVPRALMDADERAEIEVSARAFVDGTDESVAKALEKFGKKLEDVQHDVAVVKRAVHGLAMPEGDRDEDAEAEAGAGWTAWTANLLGGNVSPSRSPTPAQTFGAVITSPRLRHAASLKQLQEGSDQGPLAGLDLRIPMPVPSHVPSSSPYMHLGLGRTAEGQTPRRTLSTMYAVGGLRSASSVGLGVGFGGSPSPARTRGLSGLSARLDGPSSSSSLSLGVHDLGGVE